jgi:phospholipid-binding lipoprotein MlaA
LLIDRQDNLFLVVILKKFVFTLLFASSFAVFAGVANAAPKDTDLSYLSDDSEQNIEEKPTKNNIYDPIEPVNRGIYSFNTFLDRNLIRPIAVGYREFIPSSIRGNVRNVLSNLKEPVYFLNNVLQGDVDSAFSNFWRFTINSTIGLAGIHDVAEYGNLRLQKEDFGQTLGYYGVGNGPYLMLPLLGPSNLRDALGLGVDYATSPTVYFDDAATIPITATDIISKRETVLDYMSDIERDSFDPYATYRSVYTQYRANLIQDK